MCSELGLGPLQVSGVGSFEKIFGNFTYYLFIVAVGLHAACFQDSVIHL